jgi:ATP-dependent helicase/nuclease subunit B
VTCGFKFYARTVLGFEEPDSAPLELDALDSGRLVHNVLARFIRSLQSDPGDPVTVGVSQEYHTAMYEAAVTEIERPYVQSHDTAFHDGWLQRLFAGLEPAGTNEYDGPDGYDGLLVRTLRSLDDETNHFTTRPAYVEADIGVEADGPLDGPTAATGRDDDPVTLVADEAVDLIPDASFRFRGKVDRVDMVPDTAPTQVTAIDYKTGSYPSVSDIREGVSFQLPLYLRLLENALDDVDAIGAAYYDLDIPTSAGVSKSPFTSRLYTSYGGGAPLQRQRTTGLFDYHHQPDSEPAESLDTSSGESVSDLDPDDRFYDFLHETLDDRLTTITTAMTEGVYHPTLLGADEAKCDHCAYADVCDVRHHQRVDRAENHSLETAYVPDAVRPSTGGER